jgi:hypothetical protein
MGRPLNKKYFGNTNDPQIGGEGVASVTIAAPIAASMNTGATAVFSAPQLPGGVTATGTVTIDGAGDIAAIVMTNAGSGYTAVPTITVTDTVGGGGESTVLTSGAGGVTVALTAVKTNAITMTGRVVAGSTVALDVVKQTGSRRYLVTDGTNTGVVALVSEAVDAAGEAQIVATDSNNGTYYVTKLTAHRAVIVPGTGTQFPLVGGNPQSVPWVLDTAVLDTSVKIPNA